MHLAPIASLRRPASTSLLLTCALAALAGACGDDDPPGCTRGALCGVDAGAPADAAATPDAPGAPDGGALPDAGPEPDAGCAECAAATLVVDVPWVTAHLDDPEVQLLDARGATAYEAGHLPGALVVDPAALREVVAGVRGQVASRGAVVDAMQAAGLREGTTVVVYGVASETASARVVWTLAYYGQRDVRLLDGGLPAWMAAGQPTEAGPSGAARGSFSGTDPVLAIHADVDFVAAHLSDPAVVLVDARARSEYDAGHIPGALSVDWQRNVVEGLFRPTAELEALYAGIARDATVVAYCQTGTRASLTWLVLARLGFSDVRLYDGSWEEWSARPELPRE